MQVVKEFDLDAVRRKFQGTLAKVKSTYGENNTETVYVAEVMSSMNGIIFTTESGAQFPADFIYHRFAPGYYLYRGNYMCCSRMPEKSYHVGMSKENTVFSMLKDRSYWNTNMVFTLSEVRPPPTWTKPKNIKDYVGPIGDRLFVTETKLFYLTRPIAIRDNEKFAVEHKVLMQEVRDALRGIQHGDSLCVVTSL